MTLERVQVHPQHVPATAFRDLGPVFRRQRKRRQHLKRNVRDRARGTILERDVFFDGLWQQCKVARLANDPRKERFTLFRDRLRVNHLDDIRKRRRLTNRSLKQRTIRRLVQPSLNQTLWTRTQRLSTRHARTHDLDEVTEHLAVIDDLRERLWQMNRGLRCQHCRQQSRRVLHVTVLARVDRRFREEVWLDFTGGLHQLVKLRLRVHVIRLVQTAGGRQLRQSLTVAQLISFAASAVYRVGALAEQGSK